MKNNNVPLTEEQLTDIKNRIDACSKEVTEILTKYELAIAGQPAFNNTPMGSFVTAQVGYADTKYAPKPEKKEEIIKADA